MAWPRRLATAAAVLTGALMVVAALLVAASPTVAGLVNFGVGVVVTPLCAGLGVLIVRRTGNRVGVLLALVGLTIALTVTREIAWWSLADRTDVVADLSWLVALLSEVAGWVLVSVALLLLHFPDGRVPSPRWRWVPAALVVCGVIAQAYGAVDASVPFRPPLQDLPRPWGPPPTWAAVVAGVAFVGMLLLIIACAVSLVLRHRRASPLQRRQIRWLAIGGLAVAAYPLLCLVEILVWGQPLWFSAAVGLTGLLAVLVSTAIALLRPDLYDVDRALSGTVTWGLVSAGLLVVYAGVLVTTGVVLGRESSLAAAAATAVCALTLAPLRRQLQHRVDRRLYPLRRAAYESIDTLHRQVSAGQADPEQLEDVLRTALRDPQLRVGYRAPAGSAFVAGDGSPVDPAGGVPVLLGGIPVGVLAGGSDELSPELLRQVAERAAATVEMVRLRMELASALREAESSRARLVQIGYEERRRLERDLHDGAQQRLVSLGMAIRLAQRHLEDGTVDVHGLLDECVAELGTVVAELRQLAHGIRPSSLDDGLPAAVARLVRGLPVSVTLEVDESAMPDDIATTAYFVISEALANAVKHAEASLIRLHVSRPDGHVVVRVSDDGRGGASLSAESGLADRVAALGGRLRVASPVGEGTVVEAELPCAS